MGATYHLEEQLKKLSKRVKCFDCQFIEDIADLDARLNALESGVGGATAFVDNYSLLPDPTTVSNNVYGVINSQGTPWLPGSLGGTYYPKGFYYSDGVDWIYMGAYPYQATQAEVDAGIVGDKFVTPETLANYSGFPSGGGITWSRITTTTHTMQPNEGYGADNVLQVVFTLPTTSSFGDVIEIMGIGAGGWSIQQNANQQIIFGNQQTTSGVTGSVTSGHNRDTIILRCSEPNLEWQVMFSLSSAITLN